MAIVLERCLYHRYSVRLRKIYDMSYLRRNKLEKYSNLFGVFGWFFLRSIFVRARAFGTRHWFIRCWHSTQCAFIYRVYLMGISVSITHVCHSIFHHFQHGFYTVSIHTVVVVVIARCYSSIRIFDFFFPLLRFFFLFYFSFQSSTHKHIE